MYFSWIRSPGASGRAVPQKTAGRPWEPQTNVSKDFNPVLFERKLNEAEEGLSLTELIALYPEPEKRP